MRNPLPAAIFSIIFSGTLATACSTAGALDTGAGAGAGAGSFDTGSGGSSGAAASGNTGSGASIYAANCAGCHGADAMGASGPALAGIVDSNRVIDIIINGGVSMPAFGGSLSDAQIADVLAYLGGL